MPHLRTAALLLDTLEWGVALNTALHLGTQLGATLPDLRGAEITDAHSRRHSGVPIYPNVVLRGTQHQLTEFVSQVGRMVEEGAHLTLVDYPEQAFTTSTDEEFRDAIIRAETPILYYGAVVLGEYNLIKAITRAFKLWR